MKNHSSVRTYEVIALQITIFFNPVRNPLDETQLSGGDHDHDGLMYALAKNRTALEGLRTAIASEDATISGPAKLPHPLVRPLVLRARRGERVCIRFKNLIQNRKVGIHLVGPGYGAADDGANVGTNNSSLADHGQTVEYHWACPSEGVFPFHDGGDPDGTECGTNAHGLFGALIVEPEHAWWTDPEQGSHAHLEDGLYADVHVRSPEELAALSANQKIPFPNPAQPDSRPPKYPSAHASFREYVLFFHDEPHYVGPHLDGEQPEEPCGTGGHGGGGNEHEHEPASLMLFNYRSEPMKNREPLIWQRLAEGLLDKTVVNEEQHHSSWMFGDPATPILKAYVGDPVRIRLIHAGVKETHVWHLHVYEWHADSSNRQSPLIDAISVSPQTGHSIDPLFGAGNAQCVPGDVIWHCHLYPHFHMGMWGIFRTFETLQNGTDGPAIADSNPVYAGRKIGRYPDDTPIRRLAVLPDRQPPPAPTPTKPGFPLYIAGTYRQKSPIPPWPTPDQQMPADFDYRPATALELAAMNVTPKPGEMFTIFPHPEQVSFWDGEDLIVRNRPSDDSHDVVVTRTRLEYNDDGWHDPDGHIYYLAQDGPPSDGQRKQPLFFRSDKGRVLNLTYLNDLRLFEPNSNDSPSPTLGQLSRTDFDPNLPPCDQILVDGEFQGECGLHVHLVKFDPICADGASTGWNYLSGPSIGKKMVYRWWADEEFGVIFTHDHLFANTRQRHGLFGALIVEPEGSTFHDPFDLSRPALSGNHAVIRRADGSEFREFCFGLADWVAMYDRDGNPLEAPDKVPSHDDNGVMAVNYRCAPLRERGAKPHYWFHSERSGHGDPDTDVFQTWAGDELTFRVVQGSHEEQHSFQTHGLRWRRFRKDSQSPLYNQQTLGISEAFTFNIDRPYGPGDHLWKLSGIDDLWLGCWGLIRAYDPDQPSSEEKAGSYLPQRLSGPAAAPATPATATRRYRVVAERQTIVYREGPRGVLADPLGLVYRATEMAAPGSTDYVSLPQANLLEPLVLRCLHGERVEVELENRLPAGMRAERHPPELPVERDGDSDEDSPLPDRVVSRHVSMHADRVTYDVRHSDGANIGRNPLQSVPPSGRRTYTWIADCEPGAALLQDMADVRNHRHHGLIGALVIEPAGAVPLRVDCGQSTADSTMSDNEAWTGTRATVLGTDGSRREECVLILQDGLRYYRNGVENDGPIPEPPDLPGDAPGEAPDTEDQGHKAFNYRSELLDAAYAQVDRETGANNCVAAGRDQWLHLSDPATPTFVVAPQAHVTMHLVCAADRPRNHSFTVHGHGWEAWPAADGGDPDLTQVSAEAAVSSGMVRTFDFHANAQEGDYAYRSGILKWTVVQGLWGLLRVQNPTEEMRATAT